MGRSVGVRVLGVFLAFCLLLVGVVWGLLGRSPFRTGVESLAIASGPPDSGTDGEVLPITCVVIDAGHGGEDGGAGSAAGLTEKEVNLAVAMYLREILEAAGIPTVMTRTEDKLLYDRSVDYQGRKKVLDLAARRTIADETPGCLFVSIHMNAYPDARYGGMQVWYGTHDARSSDIAQDIQERALALMPNNRRKIKAAGSNIYLLDRITAPAVLVECGFLSNPTEAERLGEADYRKAVATVIAGAIVGYINSR